MQSNNRLDTQLVAGKPSRTNEYDGRLHAVRNFEEHADELL